MHSYLPEANFVQRELDLLLKVAQILRGERGQVLRQCAFYEQIDEKAALLFIIKTELVEDWSI